MTSEPADERASTRSSPKLGFSGEVARLYETYRRGYPASVIDAIVDVFGLSTDDSVIDLGCGTGQLTVPLAKRVRVVVGVDPEPDMLWLARGHDSEAPNITWVLGSDEDLQAIGATVHERRVGAVTVATALHWMDDIAVFDNAYKLVRPGGGVAVVTNGKPLWDLDIAWSYALRAFLDHWNGRSVTMGCGTDDQAQQRYRDHLAAAGFQVRETRVAYTDELDIDRLVGGVLSAFSARSLPQGDDRQRFRDGTRDAVGDGPFSETVDVGLMFGVRE